MAKRQRHLIDTPVRRTVSEAANHLKHVSIDNNQIEAIADEWASDDFELPEWRAPVFLDESEPGVSVDELIDFFFVGNSINFAFRDFETGEKFKCRYKGNTWSGAMGMWACLKRAYESGVPILSGRELSKLSKVEVQNIFRFREGPEMPMLDERHLILTSIGDRLATEYRGSFHNLIKDSEPCLYAEGEGIVDRLVTEVPYFRDSQTISVPHNANFEVHFHKRAQLAPAMVYGRLQNQGEFEIDDPAAFTVFADYNLPNILRHLGAIEYDSKLSQSISRGELMESGCREEVEIRCATVYASDLLLENLNERRSATVYAPELDYKLFSEREEVDSPVHRVETTNY